MEELVEALTFAHYLKTQKLISYDELSSNILSLSLKKPEIDVTKNAADLEQSPYDELTIMAECKITPPVTVSITEDDYLYGLFDLTGEMMRFATTTSALTPSMALAADAQNGRGRTILQDMQDLGSFFEMLPQSRVNVWEKKKEVLIQSVRKVERLGYDRIVRGAERPAGWVPDMNAGDQPADFSTD